MHLILSAARWLLSRLAIVVVALALVSRVRDAWRRGRQAGSQRRQRERTVLPSLYEVHPGALAAPRRRVGLQTVPLDRIVGTLRQPSQNTADFLPLPALRGRNWAARWQRINRANDSLAILPPADLVKVGDDYWVADGHNRVAAALASGAAAIDADVTELLLPGQAVEPMQPDATSMLLGADEAAQAGLGRLSYTADQRLRSDELTREQLIADRAAPPDEHEWPIGSASSGPIPLPSPAGPIPSGYWPSPTSVTRASTHRRRAVASAASIW